jgi:hypothetical protein
MAIAKVSTGYVYANYCADIYANDDGYIYTFWEPNAYEPTGWYAAVVAGPEGNLADEVDVIS